VFFLGKSRVVSDSTLIMDGLELIRRGLKTAGGVSELYIGRPLGLEQT
jgi:hypothetical protein